MNKLAAGAASAAKRPKNRWESGRLDELFAPRSVALVGASDRSKWASVVFSALARGGFPGSVELVNGRGGEVFGRRALARLTDLREPVDLAFVMVPGPRVLAALEDAAAAGVRNAVVLSAGFAEAGEDGRVAQEALVRLAEAAGMAILGPNTLGFLSTHGAVSLHPNSLPAPPLRGHVALVSQSGALNGGMLGYCFSRGIGVSKVVSLGNEAVLDAADVIGYLADDSDTRAIAVFLEGIRRPDEFVDALRCARRNAKPVVIRKVGRHEVTARVAAAHTGAFVGDDRVIGAVLRQHAAIRVDSLEELLTTASVLSRIGVLRGRRLAVAGISGGACDIIADRASDVGLDLPPFSDATVKALRAELPNFGTVNNPLDVTGAAVSDQALFGRVVTILGEQSGADVLLVQHDIPTEESGAVETFRNILRSADTLTVPTLVFGTLNKEVPVDDARFDKGSARIQSGGIEQIIAALGYGAWWSDRMRTREAGSERPVLSVTVDGLRAGVWSEARSRALLASGAVPLVPADHVHDVETAVAAARRFGYPVVVKANRDDLPHKTEVGAVHLDLRSDDDVRAAVARTCAAGDADGVLVSPMRPPATELIVGVARTESWGAVLAVGFGGVLTEVQSDTVLRQLPVTADDVHEMLGELRNAAMLDGVRGRPAADRAALVEAILRVTDVAAALGPHLEALEVNPLAVDGGRIEALDALVSVRTVGDAEA